MRSVVVSVAFVLCGCSRTPGSNGNGNTPTSAKPGAITVHFRNDSKTDLFVEAPASETIDVRSGERALGRGHFCQDICGPQCVCRRCGDAEPLVQIVPAGGAIDVAWKGDFYVEGTCTQGAQSCGCGEQNFLSSGPATITLRGRRATKPVKPASVSSGTFNANLDGASPACTAKVDVVVGEKPQTISATFACDG